MHPNTTSPPLTPSDLHLLYATKDQTFHNNLYSPTSPSSNIDPYSPFTTDRRLSLAWLSLQLRELETQYELSLSGLHAATLQLEDLRQENLRLRKANTDLNNQLLNKLSPVRKEKDSGFLSVVNDLRRLSLVDDVKNESPTSVLDCGDTPFKHVPLPKSISIRSSRYLKDTVTRKDRVLLASAKEAKMGGFEVYGQGMVKTELCNKWEETGACPYGDHCQFAHGIEELRPVIRHPRYKTEVCRMVLAGQRCPYGHRCHFRHVLAPHETSL